MVLFDYFFFRMTRAYMKRDGREATTAKLSLSTLQCLLFTFLGLLCFKPFFPREVTAPYSKQFGWLGVSILVAFIVFNYQRYDRKKYNELLLRWGEEPRTQKVLRGLLVYTAVPIVLVMDLLLISVT
jgi:hypothetical protein